MARIDLTITAILLFLMFIGFAVIGAVLFLSIIVGDIPGAVIGALMLIAAAFIYSALNGILKQLHTPLVRG